MKIFPRALLIAVAMLFPVSSVLAADPFLDVSTSGQPEIAKPLPWLVEKAVRQEPAKTLPDSSVEEDDETRIPVFSWLYDNIVPDLGLDSESETSINERDILPPAPLGISDGQAKVEVAEAIRVPLTDDLTKDSTMKLEPRFSEEPEPMQPVDLNYKGAGWLNVEAFESDGNATAFWQVVRTTVPARAAGLRVRVVKPLLESARPIVSLNIGPFASAGDAQDFCREGVAAVNHELNCRFTHDEPQNLGHLVTPKFRHGDRYNARRRAMESRAGVVTESDNVMPPSHPVSSKLYWVQVVSAAPSQIDALGEWEKLRSAHDDLLSGLRTRISASLAGSGGYSVRVGPVESAAQAAKLCNSLKEHEIDCRIYSSL